MHGVEFFKRNADEARHFSLPLGTRENFKLKFVFQICIYPYSNHSGLESICLMDWLTTEIL